MSLVPITVNDDEVSALASAGAISRIAAATSPKNGTPSSRRTSTRRRGGWGKAHIASSETDDRVTFRAARRSTVFLSVVRQIGTPG